MNRLARVALSTARVASARFAAPMARPVAQRFFSTATPSTKALAEAIAAEIKHEAENVALDEELVEATNNIQKYFTISQKVGESTITLQRTFNDETIVVNIDCQDVTEVEPSYDEEQEEEQASEELPSTGHNFEVIIKKNDSKLICALTAVTDGSLIVNSVTHATNGDLEGTEEETKGYFGPSFQDLDENVQQAFLAYLQERNIDSDLAIYVLLGSFNKEQNEYVNWLKAVNKFLA